MRSLVLSLLASIGLVFHAHAADLPVKGVPLPAASPACQLTTMINCSGPYLLFGIVGNGVSGDILGAGLNNSVFQNGMGIVAGGGYQLWSGQLLAGINARLGYDFSTNNGGGPNGNRFIGMEMVQLGYNFFPNASLGTTTSGQSPTLLTVPANLLQSTTPYFNFGGCQVRGATEGCLGGGLQTVIASGWSSAADYAVAPSQNGRPTAQLIMLSVLKHF